MCLFFIAFSQTIFLKYSVSFQFLILKYQSTCIDTLLRINIRVHVFWIFTPSYSEIIVLPSLSFGYVQTFLLFYKYFPLTITLSVLTSNKSFFLHFNSTTFYCSFRFSCHFCYLLLSS